MENSALLTELERSFTEKNYQTWLGVRLVRHKPGFVHLELPVRPEFLNTLGTVHGGFLANLADSALCSAILSELPPGITCSSIEIKVNYLLPVRGNILRADASVIRRGKNIGVSRAELFAPDGALAAVATGTFMIQSLSSFSCLPRVD
ncbi:acyl-CoA thioesterase [Geobacter metallireducens GS-15]|uniref:Acyl-CoA thioesterase n=1 Tax=Geobacter metallireducens (strain ATCC 53774 / DSM 7210 / GS-15) TaxID=269799 RepID=Q39TE5_GEOMG|nr:PaaI family thioesterase [Geobacter metallireducens]ABB32479.1 acyl-CoA thioesterase [Geobacter metallireducens GS-15]